MFFNWDSLVLDWYSQVFTRRVPGLTIATCNKITAVANDLSTTPGLSNCWECICNKCKELNTELESPILVVTLFRVFVALILYRDPMQLRYFNRKIAFINLLNV